MLLFFFKSKKYAANHWFQKLLAPLLLIFGEPSQGENISADSLPVMSNKSETLAPCHVMDQKEAIAGKAALMKCQKPNCRAKS